MTTAVPEPVRTHGEAGSSPFAATQGFTGTANAVRLVCFLLGDGAQSADPADRPAVHHLSRWTAHPRIGDALFETFIQEINDLVAKTTDAHNYLVLVLNLTKSIPLFEAVLIIQSTINMQHVREVRLEVYNGGGFAQ